MKTCALPSLPLLFLGSPFVGEQLERLIPTLDHVWQLPCLLIPLSPCKAHPWISPTARVSPPLSVLEKSLSCVDRRHQRVMGSNIGYIFLLVQDKRCP